MFVNRYLPYTVFEKEDPDVSPMKAPFTKSKPKTYLPKKYLRRIYTIEKVVWQIIPVFKILCK